MPTKIRRFQKNARSQRFFQALDRVSTFFQTYLLLAAPAAFFFSFHPVLRLGASASMNFELSITLIWLALFCLASLPKFFQNLRFYSPRTSLLLFFPAYAFLSILWSANPLRATLTAILLAAVYFAIFSILPFLSSRKSLHPKLLKSFFYSSLVVAAFCWLQCFLDVLQLPRSVSLLCPGCTYLSFGFPHPNGFAIEPQFMGNLLLAPTLAALFYLLKSPKPPVAHLKIITFFLITTLFLTFSRGAIYSFTLGVLVLFLGYFITARRFRPLFFPFAIIVSAFLVSLAAQGVFASLAPTNDTFFTGITKSIHQLSLGRLDFRSYAQSFSNNTLQDVTHSSKNVLKPLPPHESSHQPNHQSNHQPSHRRTNSQPSPNSLPQSHFSGYVAESTNIRLKLSQLALDVWDDQRPRLLFGAGLGSAGTVIYESHPELGSAKEIVQNQYVSLLLELGILGLIFLLLPFLVIAKRFLIGSKTLHHYLILGLIISFAASLCFFAGLPNALHIYLSVALLLIITKQS